MASLLKEYINKITINNIKTICEQFKKKLYDKYTNNNTRINYLSRMNTAIKTKLGETAYKISYPILLPSKVEKKQQMKVQKAKYLHKLDNRIGVDYTKYIDLLNSFKTSGNYYDAVACLMLSCGRRAIEIVKVGVFKPSTSVQYPNMINMSDIAKKRTSSLIISVDFPLIELTPAQFMRILGNVRRTKYGHMSNTKVIAKINARINERFKTLGSDVTADVIRGVWVDIIYKQYATPNVSEIKFKAQMLGHEDLSTLVYHYSRAYASNYIKFSDITNANVGIEQLNKKIDDLLKLIKK